MLTPPRLSGIGYDLRFALRGLRKTPGFTAIAIVILALGTGANAAMFSVIDGVMLRSPFDKPDEIVNVSALTSRGTLTAGIPADVFQQLTTQPHLFSATAVFSIGSPIVTHVDVPRRTQVECVPASMRDVLGLTPIRGRWFTADEDRPGGAAVAVASYRFWQDVLNADPDVVGRSVALDGEPVTIVGVMGAGFDGPLSRRNRDLWVPLGQTTTSHQSYGCRALSTTVNGLARLRAGVTPDAAATAVNAMLTAPAPKLVFVSITEDTFGDLKRPLVALTGAVLAVLLIACANVANLSLERLVGRRREIAVRLALGASRGRVIRQTVIESLLLTLIAAAAGVLIARVTLQTIVSLLPQSLPHLDAIQVNLRVLAASIGAALVGGVGIGLVPAIQSSSVDLRSGLTESTRSTTAGHRRLRGALVIAELALGVVLLVGALLMVRTFLTLRPSAPGFDPQNKTVALVRLPAAMELERRQQFLADIRTKLLATPGIRAVAATTYLPMSRSVSFREVTVGGKTGQVFTGEISENYLDVMSVPVRRGRGFQVRDTRGTPAVAVVNEEFVRRWLFDREPLGATVKIGGPGPAMPSDIRIVGVIGDIRAFGSDTRPRPQIYFPVAQTLTDSPYLVVHGAPAALAGLPPRLREMTSNLLPNQLVDRIDDLETLLGAEVAQPRFGAWLLGSFATLAVLLGGVGLAATLAWSVAERRREIGVRMALGAKGRDVAGLVLRQTVWLSTIGIAIGLGLAALGSRLLEGWLYGITSTDKGTYVACALFMLVITALASYLPARRATRVDPVVAMRVE